MNTITIIGNIGQDPVPRFTPSGQKVTSFSVAVKARKAGEDVTTWFRVSVWGDRFDKMMAHLKKGSYIVVTGELGKPEIWQDKQGQNQIRLEINANALNFMPGNKTDGASKQMPLPNITSASESSYGNAKESEPEDELPF